MNIITIFKKYQADQLVQLVHSDRPLHQVNLLFEYKNIAYKHSLEVPKHLQIHLHDFTNQKIKLETTKQ